MLGQPDWLFLSLVSSAHRYIAMRPQGEQRQVSLKREADCRGRPLLAELRNKQILLYARGLFIDNTGRAVMRTRTHNPGRLCIVRAVDGRNVTIPAGNNCNVWPHTDIIIPVELLNRVDNNICLTAQIRQKAGLLYPEHPWVDTLFPDLQVRDIREEFVLNENAAYRYPLINTKESA